MSAPHIDDRDWSALTLGERIRQIEAKAVRKLQQPSRSQELVGFLD